MSKKVLKVVMIIMIVAGIAFSVSNFLPRLEAGGIFGTTTNISSPDALWHYYGIYGIEGLADRHMEGDLYCCDQSSDCVIALAQ